MLSQPPIVLAKVSIVKAINYLLLVEDTDVSACISMLKDCDDKLYSIIQKKKMSKQK